MEREAGVRAGRTARSRSRAKDAHAANNTTTSAVITTSYHPRNHTSSCPRASMVFESREEVGGARGVGILVMPDRPKAQEAEGGGDSEEDVAGEVH